MSPLLEMGMNLEDMVKFTRDGDRVAIGEIRTGYDHADIAKENGIGTPTGDDHVSMEVDDAGRLSDYGDYIVLSGESSTCVVRGDKNKAREVSAGVVANITGKRVEIEGQG